MKNFLSKKILIGLCVVIVILIALSFRGAGSNPKDGSGVVTRQDIMQRVTIAGTVTPLRKTIITAPYNGYVKKLYVKVGDKVQQGDPIVSVVQSLQSGDNSFPLRSPLTGTVVQVEKSEGEFVKEGEPKEFILRIDDNTKLYVIANAPEIDRVKVRAGQEVIIKASAVLTRTYKGIIRELSLAAREKDQWSRSQVIEFPIRIEMTDADDVVKSGMSVVIDVITAKKEKVLMLRHEFIRRDNAKYYVILKSGERRDIQVGIQNEEGFEVTSGLQEGDRIQQIDFSNLSKVD